MRRINDSDLLRYGIEETVILQADQMETSFDADKQILAIANHKLKIFDKVMVEISVDQSKQQLRILCLSPPLHTPTNSTHVTPSKHVLESSAGTQKRAKTNR